MINNGFEFMKYFFTCFFMRLTAVFSSYFDIGLSFAIFQILPNLSNLFDTINPNGIFNFQIRVVLISVQNHAKCSLITEGFIRFPLKDHGQKVQELKHHLQELFRLMILRLQMHHQIIHHEQSTLHVCLVPLAR